MKKQVSESDSAADGTGMQRKVQTSQGRTATKVDQIVRKTVDHNYTDYSQVSEGEILDVLKRELPPETELFCSTDRTSEQTDRESVAFKKAFGSSSGSNQEEMLEELRRQPNMDITDKLRILCDCLRRNTGGISKPFPLKLMEMLANKDTQHILSWMPHGRGFKIFHQSNFVDIVLPLFFFNNIKYTSFNRQLNLWGFKRLTKGQDNGAYYHELFLRGKPLLAMRMKRQRIKGTGVKLSSDPSREPNFYSADFPQLPECEFSAMGNASLGEVEGARCPSTLRNSDNADSEMKGNDEDKEKLPYKLMDRVKEFPAKIPASRPNFKSESSNASPPGLTEDSPDDVSKLQCSGKKTKRPRDESTLLFGHSIPQMPFLTQANSSRGDVAVGHSTNESSSGSTCFDSRGMSNFPSHHFLPSRDQLLQREINEVEFVLRKQRQELELMTALTELKKQEYDVITRMCQAGSSLHMVGRSASTSFPFASQENTAMGSSLALLHDQLVSVRSLQRRQLSGQQALSSLAEYVSSNGTPLSHNEHNFSSANSNAPVSPGGAMAARRLSLIRTNEADSDEMSFSSGAGRPNNAEESGTEEQFERLRRAGI